MIARFDGLFEESYGVVPPSGFTARLTTLVAAAMAFLAVFALALSLAAGRVASTWSDALAQSVTIRISAQLGSAEDQTERVLEVLRQTRGVASARALNSAEQQALLEPWFGEGLLLDDLPLPRLVEVTEMPPGIDLDGLRQRLRAEAPAATVDSHSRWRQPLVRAAQRLRVTSQAALILILGATGAMITLAASAALAANSQVIRVLRLVGATDGFIAGAFVRRFTFRALVGAVIGTAVAVGVLMLFPASDQDFLTGLRLQGAGWLLAACVPVFAAALAWVATWIAAHRVLKALP